MTQDTTIRGHQEPVETASVEAHQAEDLGFALPAPSRTSRTARDRRARDPARRRVRVRLEPARQGARPRWRCPRPPARATRVQVIKPKVIEQRSRARACPARCARSSRPRSSRASPATSARWLVDIGDKVTAGQLLAEIDTPDLDAQLAQARAQLAQAQAAVKQVDRAARLLADEQPALRVARRPEAGVEVAGRADPGPGIDRRGQRDLGRVQRRRAGRPTCAGWSRPRRSRAWSRRSPARSRRAPSSAATWSPRAPRTPLYVLVATDPVRVFIDVPQTVAPSVRSGIEAALTVREYPGRRFAGKVTRSAGALDPDLHTMTTEVQVPNPDGALLPGMYVQAELTLPVPHHVVEIPATALYNDAQGLRVAVVDAQQKLHFAPITIERDTGATLQIATGLGGDERVVKIAVPGADRGRSAGGRRGARRHRRGRLGGEVARRYRRWRCSSSTARPCSTKTPAPDRPARPSRSATACCGGPSCSPRRSRRCAAAIAASRGTTAARAGARPIIATTSASSWSGRTRSG